MNWMCFRKFREADCFCSRYDENRQTMFYCGFFTSIAGFLWLIIGVSLKCAFFTQAFGPSVTAIACGIMVVGVFVFILGICLTISIVCSGKVNNKTGCVSTSSAGKLRTAHSTKKDRIYFDSPLEIGSSHNGSNSPFRSGSFSSAELNPSSSSSVLSSSSPISSSAASYKSDIAIIA